MDKTNTAPATEPVKTPEPGPAGEAAPILATTTPKPAESAPAAAAPAPEAKPEDSKVTPEKPVVPEKYDLKLPEGSHLKPDAIEKIASFAKERGLSNEQAQAVLDREHQALDEHVSAQQAALKERQAKWLDELKADKEVGGEALKENAELAKRLFQKFGDSKLTEDLNVTELGNYPPLFRFAVKVARAMAEDKLVIPGVNAGGKKSIQDILYGSEN